MEPEEKIRVSERVKRELDRRRRDGESYNDLLDRLIGESGDGDFYDGFGLLSDAEAEQLRERRRESKEERTRRIRERTADDS